MLSGSTMRNKALASSRKNHLDSVARMNLNRAEVIIEWNAGKPISEMEKRFRVDHKSMVKRIRLWLGVDEKSAKKVIQTPSLMAEELPELAVIVQDMYLSDGEKTERIGRVTALGQKCVTEYLKHHLGLNRSGDIRRFRGSQG